MNIEGLWTVQFASSEEEHPSMQVEEQLNRGGIFVLSDNRLLGGGLSYYFVGTYKLNGSKVEMTVNTTKYNDIVSGPFGPANETRLIFKGIVDGNTMTLHGHVEDNPVAKLIIKAVHRSGLS